MEEVTKVGIADWKLCKAPGKITTIGLGSCVGIVIYSATSDYCGLLHILLPSSKDIKNNANRAKFADTGLEDLIGALEQQGMRRSTMRAKIAGGAAMFQFSTKTEIGSIGDRNIQAVKDILAGYNIPIVSEDTGRDYGRTIVFDSVTKDLTIYSAGKTEKRI